MKIKSKNFDIAYYIIKKQIKGDYVVFLFNKEKSPFTNKDNILDIFVYNCQYDVLDWVYSVEDYNDKDIVFPYYTFLILKRFVEKSFNSYKIIISGKHIPEYNIQEYINENIVLYNLYCKSNTKIVNKELFFKVNLLKIQMYLNYMDTDSIPFYMKNIGVLYNEYNEFEKACLWLENAYRINSNLDIYDQFIISLTGLKRYDDIIKNVIEPKTFIQISSLGFAYKNKGLYKKSLDFLKKAYSINKVDWIKNDIDWINNEINQNL
ncbi:MAG: hypothetical protein M0R46_10975 [Candidatus Muirbacterium halophilum]|nr:hypothetical protein [Candidatus Muirbacterium halophilum]MCK9476437.1 hypothetical protein [Candidatus Muirbacterium halophilum]